MRLKLLILYIVNSMVCGFLFSATTLETKVRKTTTLTSEGLMPSSSDSKIIGSLEIRPSYRSNLGEFHSEDSLFLGYQFNKTNNLVYKQEFNTNLYDPKLAATTSGLNGYLFDGYFRGRSNNLYKADSFSMSYEARGYLPTWSVKRSAGLITAVRNYAKLKYQASPGVAFTCDVVPVVHLYQQAGSLTLKGPVANPIFESRESLGFEYQVSDNLKVLVPILISSSRYRAYDSRAINNNQWGHKLWVNPEVFYSVNSNLNLGLGYYTDNLIKNNNFTDTIFSEGFKFGTTQLILATSL